LDSANHHSQLTRRDLTTTISIYTDLNPDLDINPLPSSSISRHLWQAPDTTMSFTTRTRLAAGPSLDTLIAITYTKLDTLSHLLSGNKDESDLLRRGVLLQNVLERGVDAREKERKQRTEESIFGMTRRKSSATTGGWKGAAFESGMDALFEQDGDEDEDEEDDDDALEIVCQPSHINSVHDTAQVMDPTQFSMTSPVEEGEEAWFEETWNELQSMTSPEHEPIAIAIMDQEAEVYPIEDDDSIFSASTSEPSSRSITPSPPPFFKADDIALPPSPRLKATKIADKLDGPIERGTLAPALECAISVEQVLLRYEILEDEEEEELNRIDLQGINQATDSVNRDYLDADDVPDFETDFDSDEDERDEAGHDRQSHTPWLVTPTEDVLDDFGSGGSFEDLHQYGFEHSDEEGMYATDGKDRQHERERRMIEIVR
jgi:hypothetical protein